MDFFEALEDELINSLEHDLMIETAIQLSLQTPQPVTKKIIDNDVLDNLPIIIYNNSNLSDITCSNCPISLEDFKNGDEIIQLPCSHCFLKSYIYHWLKNESASCPVCRFALKHKEIVKIETIETDDDTYWDSDLDLEIDFNDIINEID